MGLYLGGLESGINFALEPEWAYIRVGLHPGGLLFGILRCVNFLIRKTLHCNFVSLETSSANVYDISQVK